MHRRGIPRLYKMATAASVHRSQLAFETIATERDEISILRPSRDGRRYRWHENTLDRW